MPSRRSPRITTLGAVLALGVLSSACVRPGAPTVGMSKVEANLVFGVDAVPEPVETPVQQVLAQLSAPAGVAETGDTESEPAPSFDFDKPKVPLLRPSTSTGTTVVACPSAPLTAAAEVAPQPRISGDVATGTSKWRFQGFVTTALGTDTPTRTELEEGPDAPRSVRNVVKTNDTHYSFEVVKAGDEFAGTDAVTITTYDVNTAALNANPSDGVGTVTTPGIGEPERGITISHIKTVDPRSGQTLNSFDPPVGLLVLPLPVVSGDTFTTTAIDPKTGQTITRDSVVKGRDRIDACGTLVDGWLVTSKERTTGGQGLAAGAPQLNLEVEVETIFATQYGGVPIFEKLAVTTPDCDICPFELRSRLGQFPADPLTTS